VYVIFVVFDVCFFVVCVCWFFLGLLIYVMIDILEGI